MVNRSRKLSDGVKEEGGNVGGSPKEQRGGGGGYELDIFLLTTLKNVGLPLGTNLGGI